MTFLDGRVPYYMREEMASHPIYGQGQLGMVRIRTAKGRPILKIQEYEPHI